jgi:hypothetical protein
MAADRLTFRFGCCGEGGRRKVSLMILRASNAVGAVLVAAAVLAAEGCAGGSSTSSSSSGGDASTTDCAAIDKEIRDAAVKRGLDPTGVCTSTDPQVMMDFQAACANAKAKGC